MTLACSSRRTGRPARCSDTLLDVHFQHTVGVFMLLYRHVKSAQEAFGGEVINNQPMSQLHRLGRLRLHLSVEAKIEYQLFRRPRDTAEIGIRR